MGDPNKFPHCGNGTMLDPNSNSCVPSGGGQITPQPCAASRVATVRDCTSVSASSWSPRLASGERRWIYDAGAPCFAPPAVAGGTVYVGDLRGTVHAIELTSGKPVWRLDLGSDPAVTAPGINPQAITDFIEFPDRGHSLTIDHGWREVAQAALDWLRQRSV